MTDLRDFLNWFDGFAENIEKTPSPKQWAKIKERVAALRAVGPAAAPVTSQQPAKPAKKPDPVYPFIIDRDGAVKNGRSKKPVMPSEVTDTVFDLRGMDGDVKSIVWADGSTGLNGADLTIVGA